MEDFMADENTAKPEAAEAPVKAKKKKLLPTRYKITNVVRRVNTRVRRVVAPGRRRFKQFVCGKRLLRKQSILVTAEEMEKHKAQLFEQVREGAIQITAPDGSVLCVDTLGNLMSRKGMKLELVDQVHVAKAAPESKPMETEKEDAPEETKDETPEEEVEETEKEDALVPSDDLTDLPGVGPGRAKKLDASGISSFKQLAEMSPGDLVKIVGSPLTEDQAATICDAASDKEEV